MDGCNRNRHWILVIDWDLSFFSRVLYICDVRNIMLCDRARVIMLFFYSEIVSYNTTCFKLPFDLIEIQPHPSDKCLANVHLLALVTVTNINMYITYLSLEVFFKKKEQKMNENKLWNKRLIICHFYWTVLSGTTHNNIIWRIRFKKKICLKRRATR